MMEHNLIMATWKRGKYCAGELYKQKTSNFARAIEQSAYQRYNSSPSNIPPLEILSKANACSHHTPPVT
eukprot:3894872-Ditylum_brightwellii.AAC.1